MLCCQVTSPGDRGHTQLAITRPRGGAGGGADTPSSEPGFSLTDQVLKDLFEVILNSPPTF